MPEKSKKLELAYCNDCGDLVEYTTKEEVVNDVYKDIPFQYKFNISRCINCGCEVADSLDYNYDKSDARWNAIEAKLGKR